MKKNSGGNVFTGDEEDEKYLFTGDEKLFIQFEIDKKRHGIERMLLINSMPTDLVSKNNIEIEYEVVDDYNEEIIKGDNTARIGITLTNFMNKIDKIYPVLNEYSNLIKDFDISKMQELYTNIESIIKDFNLEQSKLDYNVSQALLEIHQLMARTDEEELKSCKQIIQEISQEENPNEEISHVFEFVKRIFDLKNKNYHYYSYSNLIWITSEILNKDEDTMQQNYNYLLLELIKKLEQKIKVKVNEPLKVLVYQIFKIFYDDFRCASNPKNLLQFFVKIKNNMEKYPYNTYYKNIYKYLSNIEDKKVSDMEERFEKFSLQEMSKIFVDTLLEDISYILENYINVPDTITNTNMLSKKIYKYELSSFNELFYISRYYIKKDGNNLTKCNLCGKYFITQGKIDEEHCRRIYKKKLNCCEYSNFNARKSNSLDSRISKEKNNIKTMLRKQDLMNKTKEQDDFNERYKTKLTELNSEKINLEERQRKLLEWLKAEHTNLKKSK